MSQIRLFEEPDDEVEKEVEIKTEIIKIEKKKYDSGIRQLCFHNEDGICSYLGSDLIPCDSLCNGFKSSNTALCNRINKKLKTNDKIKPNGLVTMWHINKAGGIYPDGDSIQSKVRI